MGGPGSPQCAEHALLAKLLSWHDSIELGEYEFFDKKGEVVDGKLLVGADIERVGDD